MHVLHQTKKNTIFIHPITLIINGSLYSWWYIFFYLPRVPGDTTKSPELCVLLIWKTGRTRFSHQLNKIILASCYIKSRKILTCLSETFLPIKPLLDSHFFVYGTEPNNNETKHVVFNCLPCCLFWQNFNPDIIKFLKWSGCILLGVEWQLAFI